MINVPQISLSIVSHRQLTLLGPLLHSLSRLCGPTVEVLLTLNVPEDEAPLAAWQGLGLRIIRNPRPLGFGANHNQAFAQSGGDVFCVVNPDISWAASPLPTLVAALQDPRRALVAPMVVNTQGGVEDSARRFPTPAGIVRKALGAQPPADYRLLDPITSVDWVGGMFMALRREVFAELGGFDTRYFLYYEDVDLCARARLAGYDVAVCREAKVAHDARRHSHRNLRYATWHARSMLRFFTSPGFRALRRQGVIA